MLQNAKLRATARGTPFSITYADLEQLMTDRCPILGTPLRFHRGQGKGPRNNSPSLDCIVRDRGYVRGNILICSHRANRIKSDATIGELHALADFYARLDVPEVDQKADDQQR